MICARRCEAPLEDVNLLADVFRFDRTTGHGLDQLAIRRLGRSEAPQLDASGEVVVFTSRHPIDERDTRHDFDMFVRAPGASTLTMRDDVRRHPR
jgi:hypothetical protein